MAFRAIRWILMLLAGVACIVVPACSDGDAAARPPLAVAPAAAAPGADAAVVTPDPKPAGVVADPAAPARRHPFAPVVDTSARKARIATSTGHLQLKGVLGGADGTAVVQEGTRFHYVRKGEQIGHLVVLEIREDEVVLGAGQRKRVLSLYQP